ncbi:cache domain-containing sensor histidine kinase [Butyrivibrio sp. MC2021]|uniref:cache domain-containing sensor histidine kinase n=1 Tax=Butyrivibrio sp. MC2021 TaxID=1408306 RepID=UPI00047E218D|nr:sensor histidine kinase [Butyrivibrio sp. MC2021]
MPVRNMKRHNDQNKNIVDMTLRDMEAYKSDRISSSKERARNISIKYKIAFMTVLVALIPMTVLTVMMLFFYNRAIMERGNKHIEENIRIMADRITSVLNNGELCSNNLTIEFSSYYNDKSMKQVTRDSKVASLMSQSLLIYHGISSIVFIDTEGRFYSTDPKLLDIQDEIVNSDYVQELKEASGKTYLLDPTKNLMNRNDKEIITMGKHGINVLTGSTFGYLFINMNKDYLIESSESDISYYFLYDPNGFCISTSDVKDQIYGDEKLINSLFSEERTRIRYKKENYLIARGDIERYHWTIVGVTNLNRFNVTGKDLQFILFTTFGVTAVLLLLSMTVSVNMITKPLKMLHDGAQQIAEGDMSFRFRFKYKDEIGRLGRIFNYMTQKNLELIKQVNDEAKKKREYELALIQEQVKPHFLYNTLDIIIMLIEMNRSKEAARVTQKLANYYKNSLSGSEDIVTIERESQIIRDYLDLQTMRYGDKFNYDIDIDESIDDCQIPKMTLQPLVENAIYHGIKNKAEWGKILVSGHKLSLNGNDICELIVQDDGVGMDEEELTKLNEILTEDVKHTESEDLDEKEAEISNHDRTKGGSHFGLYSVSHRIKLYFGNEYGARIESKKGEGTKVVITLPYKK